MAQKLRDLRDKCVWFRQQKPRMRFLFTVRWCSGKELNERMSSRHLLVQNIMFTTTVEHIGRTLPSTAVWVLQSLGGYLWQCQLVTGSYPLHCGKDRLETTRGRSKYHHQAQVNSMWGRNRRVRRCKATIVIGAIVALWCLGSIPQKLGAVHLIVSNITSNGTKHKKPSKHCNKYGNTNVWRNCLFQSVQVHD